MKNFPFVSILIPCRNEEEFISKCLHSILAQDYPKDRMEVLVVDGMSEDMTRKIVEFNIKGNSFIKLLDNQKRITPCAFNKGIKNSKGSIIAIIGAHSTIEKDYLSKCVEYLRKYNADNVGGITKIIQINNTFIGKTIAFVRSCKFGVGNATYITGSKEPKWVDTVFGGCYKREVFDRIGFFNELLVHSQDIEFNLRLKKAGLRTLLVPEIISYYYARTDFKSFIRHNFINGIWAVLPFKYSNIVPVSLRHLIPLSFILSLCFSAVLAFFIPTFLWLFLLITISYTIANLYFSSNTVMKNGDLRLFFLMPFIFTSLHISYGLGSIWGLLKLLVTK